ncbi:hypothetical protein O6H91_13G100900 [Diphasiastrum complanatum]|uniref:Uncharacterized protein n=2 Tax=Diphasiastrum complanatum TaxID=34168 RepID=A0ACC2BXT1_DIPCM|nr:hypothetical protein O6H91_13G100900 [Diphasiastrum complanatum]KAJ7534585.1 hypothetical protein O6H91_13G100900 [Diphasiastrum complanatum]
MVSVHRSEGSGGMDCDASKRPASVLGTLSNGTAKKQNTDTNKRFQPPIQGWREMSVLGMNPLDLVGRKCKVFWPLDDDWYDGAIERYYPKKKKHKVIYEDGDEESLFLPDERLKLQMSLHEEASLHISCADKKTANPDELALLARDAESCEEMSRLGNVVWAKIKGHPHWPALTVDKEHACRGGLDTQFNKDTVAVQFFGSHDFSRISSTHCILFSKGLMRNYDTKCKRPAFEQALKEVERYLKEGKLPTFMDSSLLRSEIFDEEAKQLGQALIEDEQQESLETNGVPVFKYPLDLGAFCVQDLGRIVTDSEHFHDKHYIWPEGYTASRQFPSIKDPQKMVEYRMEVVRAPMMQSLPLFRVIPDDGELVEGSTASRCWRKIYAKLSKAKERAGLVKVHSLDQKRPIQKSGLTMFGFSDQRVSKLIQSLPNARACSKYTSWTKSLAKDGEVLPAGYKLVEVQWNHLDRCNVCHMQEEYADNLLLQCDRCRIMVHMACYGELEKPDGDLWLCQLCQPGAPKQIPQCCLCPIRGGAMKPTTDGRWAHLTCAAWIPETCLLDIKRMEPIGGLDSINKERWKLICSICRVPYGVCIQCAGQHCHVAYHPLCARFSGLCMEVLEDSETKLEGTFSYEGEGGERPLRLISYCRRHKRPVCEQNSGNIKPQPVLVNSLDNLSSCVLRSHSGCARSDPYNAKSRRGRKEPEAQAAARSKQLFVESRPYVISGFQRSVPRMEIESTTCSLSLYPLLNNLLNEPNDYTQSRDDDSTGSVRSMSERFHQMKSTVHERLTFGKSAIHGWGVFSIRPHFAGDMVIEYVGEIVRPIIADIREHRHYDSLVGVGTYMFRVDDERVVDATRSGNLAHLINHSCEPNCYSRVVVANGDDHIIIFAKRDIASGEELSYDYRFASKDEQLTCYCGCPGCRGYVSAAESNDDPPRILVPQSMLTQWNLSWAL